MKGNNSRVSTGVKGLDEILKGGFIKSKVYMVRGGPGCGKTTLGLHFLVAGKKNGESVLFITLSETEKEIKENASKIGFDLKDINFLDLSPSSAFFSKGETYDIFSPSEVERESITKKIVEAIENYKPSRVFIDSLTQFRYLAPDAFIYRKQVLSFLKFLSEKNVTVFFTSESSPEAPDDDLKFMADGVIELYFEDNVRILKVTKFRGSDFYPGEHSLRLSDKRMEVFPIHALCKYLKNMGVTVFMINEVENITDDFKVTEIGASYLADNIVFIRYLKIRGEIRKAIGVLKKRTSDFEKTLRELEITRYGLKVGEPLRNLRKILTGTPEWVTLGE